MSRPILTVVPDPAPSRFDAHRQAVADRSTLELASTLAQQARYLAERAQALLATASGLDPDKRAAPTVEALKSARAAHALLGEVIAEFQP